MSVLAPLRLKPVFQSRVWGGDRLQPGVSAPVGEAWIVHEDNQIIGGVWDGRSLADVTRKLDTELLGSDVVKQTGQRFPLLIKLLDARDWLSVQVHPNDQQAARLEGEGHFGKTEAWHILEADPGAQVIFGLNGEYSTAELSQRAKAGTLEGVLRYVNVRQGDTLFTPAGCVHAIGPGLLIYEVQQTSDITYRLYDWNRPETDGRSLHLDKGLQVVGACSGGSSIWQCSYGPQESSVLTSCPYFVLEDVRGNDSRIGMDTRGESFHALTVAAGEVEVQTGEVSLRVGPLETVLIPAALGAYDLHPLEPFQVLLASVSGTVRDLLPTR